MTATKVPSKNSVQAWDFTEYAENLVKDWPALTEQQQVRLAAIFTKK